MKQEWLEKSFLLKQVLWGEKNLWGTFWATLGLSVPPVSEVVSVITCQWGWACFFATVWGSSSSEAYSASPCHSLGRSLEKLGRDRSGVIGVSSEGVLDAAASLTRVCVWIWDLWTQFSCHKASQVVWGTLL